MAPSSISKDPVTMMAIIVSSFHSRKHEHAFILWLTLLLLIIIGKDGSPALNVLAVIDGRKRFRYFHVMAGAHSDQSIFDMCWFGRNLYRIIPAGLVVLGDAGFVLLNQLMAPYPEEAGKIQLTPAQRHYNFTLSSSRITVEIAFGILKNRFRSFKAPLNRWKNKQRSNARDIGSALVRIYFQWSSRA